jgi:DNA replication protein DnaC
MNISCKKRGRLRTAYPISTSFNQIYERGLYISQKNLKEDRSSVDFSDFVDNYKIETSHLILGTPGVGKSFMNIRIIT